MDQQVELEICGNCKKEIPQTNYVMHSAHCARNITLCPTCKEPIPKMNFEEHKKKCTNKKKTEPQLPPQPPAKIEHSKYFVQQKEIEDKKIFQRQEKRLARLEKLADAGETLGHVNSSSSVNKISPTLNQTNNTSTNVIKSPQTVPTPKPKSDLLPCQYCELELPKFDLGEHENYCGARTEKCEDCGELVMFKYRQLHRDTNHGFLKLNDAEPGPRPSWDSPRRTSGLDSPTRHRPSPFRSFSTFDTYSPGFGFTTSFSGSNLPSLTTTDNNGEKLETSREISRRLDCKTEYIRNLLHDSASITAPLRSTGAVPRHLKHNKGPAPQPPRRRNPPTELVIPCEFCNTPVPHEDLIEHETGCRPDLARFNPRRRSDSPDYFIAPEPSSPDVELPCEFCADLIPASRLLSHQATCN